ncbi:DNA-J related domain-containing protein [Vibrio agarivorans]|uniref:DNA-J related domain-containing protein n=1 Tax=Vibrio agarivorans TaxID=153622 RepID=UPI0025B5CD4F|nr:DNA-J related domain-containing protein [Vibrio agarivorans]MDN3660079.1 DNA-J related domain-containing protein [Vibrio agarivorans]
MLTNDALLQNSPDIENPLIWPIFEILKNKPQDWKVHTLAGELQQQALMPVLDECSEKDLFKRNFLMMNALYQLQAILYPEKWLQVQAMDIQLTIVTSECVIDTADPLREYYTDWSHYEAEEGEVKRLLNEFWRRYSRYIGNEKVASVENRQHALRLFDLDDQATPHMIRKRWRSLALKWHPDRERGDADTFRTLCEAWNILRA